MKTHFTFKLLIKSFSRWEASLENRNVFNAVLAAEEKENWISNSVLNYKKDKHNEARLNIL